MVGEERHLPYTRPPLSKELLAGEHPVDRVHFPCDTLDAEWRLGVSARASTAGAGVSSSPTATRSPMTG